MKKNCYNFEFGEFFFFFEKYCITIFNNFVVEINLNFQSDLGINIKGFSNYAKNNLLDIN
jgi:hypothetical protein